MRTITEHHLACARRLKKLWAERRQTHHLVQTDVAQELGWSQGLLSQYLNGHTALNTDAVIAFAEVLAIEPKQIDPTIALARRAERVVIRITRDSGGNTVHETLSQPLINAEDLGKNTYGVAVVTDNFFPRYEKNDIILLDPDLKNVVGSWLLGMKNDHSFVLGKCLFDDGLRARLVDLAGETQTLEYSELVFLDRIVQALNNPTQKRINA
jgi:transcriptional regulator with XRE-family HTH domain